MSDKGEIMRQMFGSAVQWFSPEEVGWQRIGPRTWELPCGERRVFPPSVREEVGKINGTWPVHLADKLETP